MSLRDYLPKWSKPEFDTNSSNETNEPDIPDPEWREDSITKEVDEYKWYIEYADGSHREVWGEMKNADNEYMFYSFEPTAGGKNLWCDCPLIDVTNTGSLQFRAVKSNVKSVEPINSKTWEFEWTYEKLHKWSADSDRWQPQSVYQAGDDEYEVEVTNPWE